MEPDTEHPDLARMGALMQAEDERTRRAQRRVTVGIPVCWAAAWTSSHLVLGMAALGGTTGLASYGPAWLVVAGLVLVAMAVSAVLGVGAGRGRRGPSTTTGITIAVSFAAVMMALAGLDLALLRWGLDGVQTAVLVPASVTLGLGLVHLVVAAATGARSMFLAGASLLLVAVVAALVGPPHQWWIHACGGLAIALPALTARRG